MKSDYTFVSEETLAEDTNRLQITIIPPTTQRGSIPTEQHVTKPAEESINSVQQQEGGEELEECIEPDNHEYAITKDTIKNLAKEIGAYWHPTTPLDFRKIKGNPY